MNIRTPGGRCSAGKRIVSGRENFCEKAGQASLHFKGMGSGHAAGSKEYAYSYGLGRLINWPAIPTAASWEPSGNRKPLYREIRHFMTWSENVFEWVKGPRQQSAAMGGPLSKCQTIAGQAARVMQNPKRDFAAARAIK